jgi:hypothetical protein
MSKTARGVLPQGKRGERDSMRNFKASGDQHRKQTLDYRYHLTHDVLTNLNKGECCAVVGVGSCGKSRLLRHISRPETLEYHLSNAAYDHLVVLIECNGWINDTIFAAYEGIARALNEAVQTAPQSITQTARRELAPLYDAVTNERDLAYKHIMTGLNILLGGSRLKLTLLFDEFDFVFEKFDPQLFRNLRALRNAHKYQLTYLVTTRKQMPYQRAPETWADVEEFYELFADNTFAIGPYDDRDASEMIADLEQRMEFDLQGRYATQWLIEITGGHPGLIGASFRLLEAQKAQPTTQQQMASLLVHDQSTWKECRKIWDSLIASERMALRRIAHNTRLSKEDQDAITNLKAKGLVRAANNRGAVAVFSPILNEYAKQVED